jgi:hypothetical protein
VGCGYYGFWTLFLGFIQMYVPIMLILNDYFEQTDGQYEANQFSKRRYMIMFSVLVSLFWGAAPLFGWSRMDYEPTGLSCSIYENKPGTGYLLYMIINVTFYEIAPFFLVVFCVVKTKNNLKSLNKV